MENNTPLKRNIWNLVLGIIFLGYGTYRIYSLSNDIEGNILGFVLAIAFIVFGLYDLWKYYKGI
jgi:hypothetical protein